MAALGKELTTRAITDLQLECKALLEKHYYPAWDAGTGPSRLETKMNPLTNMVEEHSKLYFLYRPTAHIEWNGNVLSVQNVDELVQKMWNVRTKHTTKSIDVQPILDGNHALVTVTGNCRYNDEVTRGFSQVFQVWKQGESKEKAMYWITHDNFRWITSEEL